MAVILAVISQEVGGDGWESNPPRTPQQRPADGFEDRGRHQSSFIPSLASLYFGCQPTNGGASRDGIRQRSRRSLPTFLKTAFLTSAAVRRRPPQIEIER